MVSTPSPAGIKFPEKENPSTIPEPPAETVKPASAAAPPTAPDKLAPVLNWKPEIATSLL